MIKTYRVIALVIAGASQELVEEFFKLLKPWVPSATLESASESQIRIYCPGNKPANAWTIWRDDHYTEWPEEELPEPCFHDDAIHYYWRMFQAGYDLRKAQKKR